MKDKNIVLIMYNFPPIGAGRGIAWTFILDEISKYYNLDVITIKASKGDPIYNENKLELINSTYKVNRTNPGKFYNKLYKNDIIKKEIKSNATTNNIIKKNCICAYKKALRGFIFPDRMVFWNKYAYKKFEEIASDKNVDLVITVGFPFSTHILGKKIKDKYDTKLILDYGDPWSFNPSNETIPYWRKSLDKIVEKNIIKSCDYITVTTKSTLEEFKNKFKYAIDKIEVIPQGVDINRYNKEIENMQVRPKSKKITLFYSGIFYKDIRNPKEFFKALSNFKEDDLDGAELEILIAGKMEEYVIELASQVENSKNLSIKFLGNITLDEVINLQVSCDALLYFGNKGELQVPGKLYEYIAARRPIYCIAPVYDEGCEIIEKLNRGIVVKDEAKEIKKELIKFIQQIKKKENKFNLDIVDKYDWKIISNKYKIIIDNILRSV